VVHEVLVLAEVEAIIAPNEAGEEEVPYKRQKEEQMEVFQLSVVWLY